MTQREHERDAEGRCLACLRYVEKRRLIEQTQRATGWRREVLLAMLKAL